MSHIAMHDTLISVVRSSSRTAESNQVKVIYVREAIALVDLVKSRRLGEVQLQLRGER